MKLTCRLLGHKWIMIGLSPSHRCERCEIIRWGFGLARDGAYTYGPPDRRVK